MIDNFYEMNYINKGKTVCQLYEKHIRNHGNVRHGTKQGRQQLMRILEEDTIGAFSVENVKMSDAKECALRMKEKGYTTLGKSPTALKHRKRTTAFVKFQ